ncbi:MAG: polysaccharide deacetylase family protein [Cellvibrionaceae bacterium]|nr:polysaccharide deacetylase family protein [Cellvibrionaceae bacterium]
MPLSFLRSIFNNNDSSGQAKFSVPVLCYHSWTIGDDYSNDDHIALEQDLNYLAQQGYKILPLMALVDIIRGELGAEVLNGEKVVCLTFDDGHISDYRNASRADGSVVKSFYQILTETAERLPLLIDGVRAASFVIVGEEARKAIWPESPECWGTDWWRQCVSEGLLGVANHSWDHTHEKLQSVRQRDNQKGNFFCIDNAKDACAQIAQPQALLDGIAGEAVLPVFGYPYGDVAPYLQTEYLPLNGERLGLKAAFSAQGDYATDSSDIWSIPRFVRGYHWRSISELEEILSGKPREMEANNRALLYEAAKAESQPQTQPLKLEDVFGVVEVDQAEFLAGDLFRRRFNTDSFPETPHHYIAFVKLACGNLVRVGYIHQTAWNGCFLTGGLVSENQPATPIPKAIKALIWEHGGVAKLLMSYAVNSVPADTKAVWAYSGHPSTLKMCDELGLLPTSAPHVRMKWLDTSADEQERARYLAQVVALGPF